jgi:hypothetical protein
MLPHPLGQYPPTDWIFRLSSSLSLISRHATLLGSLDSAGLSQGLSQALCGLAVSPTCLETWRTTWGPQTDHRRFDESTQ